jgi:anti-sigma regulatory factor (Ser/Thr protein kinase)
VVAAALATHRTVSDGLDDHHNAQYVEAAAFLAAPLARRPVAPASPPTATAVIHELDHLAAARDVVRDAAYRYSAVSPQAIEQLRVAVTEVTSNGLIHGCPPVRVNLWAEVGSLTCLVEDSGCGMLHPMTGYRRPEDASCLGLWAARQLVDDLQIDNAPSGGCSVLLTVADQPL